MDSGKHVDKCVEDIAKACKLNRKTVVKAVESLITRGLVRRLGDKATVYRFDLTDVQEWVEILGVRLTDTGNVDVRAADTVDETGVRETDIQLDSKQTPKGGLLESAADVPGTDVHQTDIPDEYVPVADTEKISAEEKIQQCRDRGHNACLFKEGAGTYVRVDSKTYTLAEFQELSLDSFKETCEDATSGIEKCWQALGKALGRLSAGAKAELQIQRKKVGLSPLDISQLQSF